MDLRQSILNQTDASFSLAKHVISAHAKHINLIFSPLSIHVLLGITAAGSNGPTRDQILGFLGSNSLEELHALFSRIVSTVFVEASPLGGPVLSSANGLWVDQSLNLKPDFRHLVENVYKAVSGHADFQNKANKVREEVNAWANKETNGLIKDILPPRSVDDSTRLILANAVYFKGAWTLKFDAFSTKKSKFYLLDGSSVEAPLMSSWKDQYVRAFDGFKVLKLPYEQGQDTRRSFSMYVYLPDEKDGVAALTERVCSESGFINNHLPFCKVKLDEFGVPKFKIGFDFEASALLKGLGLVLPFHGGLTEMVDSSPLEVSGIFHKSFIEVNEEGTVAAAASAIMMLGSCGPGAKRDRFEFVADHPFLFVIREDTTGLVLFIGQLLNPLTK